jgi:hypothetical protein
MLNYIHIGLNMREAKVINFASNNNPRYFDRNGAAQDS